MLNLASNRLTSLPPEIGHLSRLQLLDLGFNRLTSLPPEIGHLSRLQSLDLANNQLTSLPPEIGYLSNLQSLVLSNNQISVLPPEISLLSSLQLLGLKRNQLVSLPPEIAQLANLQSLYLSENPLTSPSPEIVDLGLPAILAYLRELQKPGVERYEAKLILVGEARMGKSSLLRALQGLPFDLSLSPTHGIDVVRLQVAHPTIPGEKITLNMWDFGGQQIYQSTHQFFLTRRSVYLLVWDAAANPEASRLNFWLDTISALAPDARILLVATHIDQWHPTLSLEAYRQRYPQIIDACEVSNKDGRGLDLLRSKMVEAAANTPFVGMTWPRSWVRAETQMLDRPDYYVDVTTFLAICREYEIEESVAHDTLGPYLRDLGKVLYFYDDPFLRTIMVLIFQKFCMSHCCDSALMSVA